MIMNLRRGLLTAVLAVATMSWAGAEDVRGTLLVRVKDGSGAVVPGAIVRVVSQGGTSRAGRADGGGEVAFTNLRAGSYGVRVLWPGFSEYHQSHVQVGDRGVTVLDASLELKPAEESVSVASEPAGELSTEASSNAGAIVLQKEDLDALPDDPEDLAADLKAIAGPSADSGAQQILVDGFSGGRLPSKASIREIRINQNPFSAEYDRLGLGRAEVFTKPGSEQFHGAAFFKFSDAALNSRNPYSPQKPPYQSRQFGGDFGGPVTRKASLFLEFEQRQLDDNAVVHATALDSLLRIVPIQEAVLSPQRSSSLSARFDEQLGTRNTVSGRFTWLATNTRNAGVGAFVLPSRDYGISEDSYSVQLTGTSVLNARATNEVRFQYSRENNGLSGTSNGPSILVLDSFAGGGPIDPLSSSRRDRFEFQNATSWVAGRHTVKFGGRVRLLSLVDESRKNFNGLFVFSGGAGPQLGNSGSPVEMQISSLERYRRTLLFQSLGLPLSAIRALGSGPSQFLIAAGQPQIALGLADAGLFVQDDWRLSPAFSISAGLRWESQTGIADRADFAPRIGFAWAPGSGKQRKTVLRGGFGVFFQRVGEDVFLDAARFGGNSQALYVIHNPDFFPGIPTASQLAAMALPPTVRRLQSGLQDPYLFQTALSVERQLPFRVVVSTTYTNTRGLHLLMSRNTNAPVSGSNFRRAGAGDVFAYESAGIMRQNQLLTTVTRRFSGRFSLFGYYAYGRSFSNSDGAGFMPANQYDARADYGRSALDIRHRAMVGGSIIAPLGLRFNPFLLARSGAPFNITTGQDANGDSIFNDRPSFATNSNGPGVVATTFGVFNMNPAPGERLIPHNYGQGPAYCTLNFRISRTFGFGGGEGRRAQAGARKDSSLVPAGADETSVKSLLRDPSTEHRFNLTVALQARNAMNHMNSGLPIGNLSSPLLGRSNWLASSAGADSQAMGDNRRLQLQLRLTF